MESINPLIWHISQHLFVFFLELDAIPQSVQSQQIRIKQFVRLEKQEVFDTVSSINPLCDSK